MQKIKEIKAAPQFVTHGTNIVLSEDEEMLLHKVETRLAKN